MSLEEIQGIISLLHTGFVSCIILAVVSFGLTVLFFFRFNILQTIQQKTGLAARKELAAFNEQNSKTSGLLNADNSIALGERTPIGLRAGSSRRLDKAKSKRLRSKRLSGAPPGIGPPADSGALLTTRLSAKSASQESAAPAPTGIAGFVLVKEALIVHTDAEIC
jgi:hypothetical protein